MTNIIIAGTGGQGTILASRLIGEAAVNAGLNVRGSETIGMAQRGGPVTSHLRLSGGEIFSPIIPPRAADVIIAFEAGEAVRAAPFLKDGGVMVACDHIVKPAGGGEYEKEPLLRWLRAAVKNLHIVSGDQIAARCGERCLNTALVGAALRTGALPFTAEDIEEVIRKKIKPQFVERNILALRGGLSGADAE